MIPRMYRPRPSAETVLGFLFVGWPLLFAFVAVVVYLVFLHG